MVFYQQRPVYYTHRQQYPAQHAMLLHYGPANLARRSAQGNEVTAFAAGDTIGAGSYINGMFLLCNRLYNSKLMHF